MKRYVLLAGLVAACLVFSGCGNKNDKENDQNTDQTVEISEGPDENDSNLVSMEKDENTIDKSKISKYLGTKATNSGEVVITNETGREISEFYMRPTPSSDENTDEDYEGESWGSDLIQGDFTLKDNEMALLYYDKDNKDTSGNAIKDYDLQVAFEDMDASENCYFRNLDLTVTDNIVLHIDNDGVPYVTYTNTSTKQEVSTLAAARERMGLSSDSSSDTGEDEEDTQATETPTPTATPEPTVTEEPTATPTPTVSEPLPADDVKEIASGYIGKTLDQMIDDPEIGSPEGDEYDTDPGTGNRVGYHYYDGFTVYTTQNDDGSETIIAVE